MRATSGPAAALALVLSLGGLEGCAAYRPAPLGPAVDALLAPPDREALSRAAGRLDHPRLSPLLIDFARPLTPEALGVMAVIANPDLKAARARAGVADAQLFSAGLLPDPQFTFSLDHPVSPATGYINALTGQLNLDVAALRDHTVSVAGARAAREQVRLDLAWREWGAAGQARLLAARIMGLERAADLTGRAEALAKQELDRVLPAALRGDVKADDVQSRRIADADAGGRARQAERDLKAARLELNALLGLAPSEHLQIAAGAVPPPPFDAEALFQAARAGRLDLLALQAGYDSQDAAVRKSILDQFPTLQLGVTAARDTSDVRTIGPTTTFSLPLWNRNRGGVAVEAATREALRAEYAARLFTTRSDIAALVSALEIGVRQRDELAAQAGPLSRTAAAVQAAAEHGDIALSAANAVNQAFLDKQIALAALDQAIAEQVVGLELAIGAPIPKRPA